MSWIRDHFTHFVIPTMRAMIRHRDGKPRPREVKPLDAIVRPAAVCKYRESGLVYATVASMLSKQDKRREPLLELCRTLDPAGFVVSARAVPGETVTAPMLGEGMSVSGADIAHSIIWNSLRALKRLSRKLGGAMILPGRDVWPWEVISRRQHLRTVYDSRVSRTVAGHAPLLLGITKGWPIAEPEWDNSLVFDTGWNGSIHRLLCQATKKKPHSMMLSANDGLRENQLFPGHTGSRAKAIAIERFPKYFDKATVAEGEVLQDFETFEEFVKTALLTIWLWHYVSPRHIAALKERAAAIKEKAKKHKMQVADSPGYQFAQAQQLGQTFGGAYMQAPLIAPLFADGTGSSGATIYANTATSTPVSFQLSNANQIISNIVTTQPMIGNADGSWSCYGKKSKYQQDDWSCHLPEDTDAWDSPKCGNQSYALYDHETSKKSLYAKMEKKIKLSAESLVEVVKSQGKEAAQAVLDSVIQEAGDLGEAHGASMAIQGPAGPPVPVPIHPGAIGSQHPAFIDIDGKPKWVVATENGMLHKQDNPPSNLPWFSGFSTTPDLPMVNKSISAGPVIKAVKVPIATDANGNPLKA